MWCNVVKVMCCMLHCVYLALHSVWSWFIPEARSPTRIACSGVKTNDNKLISQMFLSVGGGGGGVSLLSGYQLERKPNIRAVRFEGFPTSNWALPALSERELHFFTLNAGARCIKHHLPQPTEECLSELHFKNSKAYVFSNIRAPQPLEETQAKRSLKECRSPAAVHASFTLRPLCWQMMESGWNLEIPIRSDLLVLKVQ